LEQSQRIEISGQAVARNLTEIRALVQRDALLVGVVKANAYGHGVAQVAPVAAAHADWLAVHTADEARNLRRLGLTLPILIMGFVGPGELRDLDGDVHVTVSSPQVLTWLGDYRRRTGVALPVHLKVETGTNRQGISIDELEGMVRGAGEERLQVVGLASHFANIEDTLEHDFARQQLAAFERAVDRVEALLGQVPPFLHVSCSAAALLFRETDFSMVRVGISMYGHWPSRETQLSWILEHGRDGLPLQPVLSWKTVVGQLKDVPQGETVGYGRTWTARRPTRLAVLPVGYSDGYSRALGNRSLVVVRGSRAPVVGRVCMNIMMVDVTDIADVAVGDEVVLIGRQGQAEVAAEELAGLCGTINYELLARISPGIPRLLVDRGP
jgi:alanine racemase